MATELALIIDSEDQTSGVFDYAGGTWTLTPGDATTGWYKDSALTSGGTNPGSFTMAFEGTSVAFTGRAPLVDMSQSATVSIDGDTPYNISGFNPPDYMQWYQTPVLADGKHTINVRHLTVTELDYAVVKVGPNTSLTGKTVIVDNTSPDITYAGDWKQDLGPFNLNNSVAGGLPYGNSTHRSTQAGDSLGFQFTGTSTSVFGIFDITISGNLSATYTLDGNSASKTYPPGPSPNSLGALSGPLQVQNYLLFSSDELPPGDHTLLITITRCVNQQFVLDYITYAPSLLSTPSSSSGGTESTSMLAPNSPSPTTGMSASNSDRSKLIGSLVGGVAGGLLLINLFVLLLLLLRRRHIKSRATQETVTAFNEPIFIPGAEVSHFLELRLPFSKRPQAAELAELPDGVTVAKRVGPPPSDVALTDTVNDFIGSAPPPSYTSDDGI